MNSLKKSLMLACAASVLGFGVAVAQTDPAPAAGAAPAAGDAMSGDSKMSGDSMAKMPKKHMKKSKKHMKKM